MRYCGIILGRRGGFTLLELLVVTVIIGVLAAILVPAMARRRAKRVACQETLHGLAIGVKTYLEESNQYYPWSAEMPSVNVANEPLPVTLKGNVSGARAYRCAADVQGYTRAADQKVFGSYFEGETISYDYNMGLGGRRIEKAFMYPILHESAIYVLQDFDNFHDIAAHPVTCKNILFADGHVGRIEDIAAALGAPTTTPAGP